MNVNLGDLFDHVDSSLDEDVTCIVEEGVNGTIRTFKSAELKFRSNNLARKLISMGAEPGDKVAFLSKNRAEYLIGFSAVVKARMTHVNINYRYGETELQYLFENSDARFVFFESDYSEQLNGIRRDLPLCEHFIEICEDNERPVNWAHSFEALSKEGDGEPLEITRDPKDLFFMYTGGTTGMPKGVMWEQCVLWNMIGRNFLAPAAEVPNKPEEIDVSSSGGGLNNLIVLPFMHGAGLYTAINALGYGNTCVLPRSKGFDPDLALRCIDKHQVMVLTISGDAFAKPIVDALDANRDSYALQSLHVINSTAMIFSPHHKKAILNHLPEIMIMDNVGSSESSGSAMAVVTKDSELDSSAVVLKLTPGAKVFNENLEEVEPGSGEKGFLAIGGNVPLGYYKDEKKTAETFITVDGIRYSRPGDWVEPLADGSVKFLGRGNMCINSGGEKIFPEEVEAALKSHDAVNDCVIVGVPDSRFGQAVTAVVELVGNTSVEDEQLREYVRAHLSGYKVPRHIVYTDKVYRAPNGKADYPGTKAFAVQEVTNAAKCE